MNVYPIHTNTADKRHWVVRWLRYTGYLEVIAVVLVGLFYSYNMLTPLLYMAFQIDVTICALIAIILGGFVSFVAGLGISLPCWALSMMIDDLHALRVYSQGYSVTDVRPRGE